MTTPEKIQLRQQLSERLAELNPEQRKHKSRRACDRLVGLEAFDQAQVVMLFLSLPREIDTASAVEAAWARGKTVVVPQVLWEERALEPVVIRSWDQALEAGHGGTRHPADHEIVSLERIDLVVTPGLGFDTQGHRLGRGMAFYDRFFARPGMGATRCGLAFFEQIVDQIPVSEHDRSVDVLVTDEQVIWP